MPDKPHLLAIAPLPEFLVGPLPERFICHHLPAQGDRQTFLREHGREMRALVGLGGSVYEESILSQLPALEIIAVHGVGYNGVPLEYCRKRGLRVTNTPDVLTDDVADIALALVLMTSRGLIAANRYLRAGEWQKKGNFKLTTKPGGKRAGIFGLGRIGKAIAWRLAHLDMEIGYHGRTLQDGEPFDYFESLIELAEWCDFLIVACPGGPETHNAVNKPVLAALGAKGTLINIARGTVVDEPALVDALQRGVIKGAGLDVFADEPRIPAPLLTMENVVLLPHVGSATVETRRAMADLVVKNLEAHFSGEPLPTPVV
jgi:lactate dehydrogenase-like 2-hydroxyacid dehydrogenase